MFCGKCGTQNPDTAAFCKSCGARLNGQAKPAVKKTVQSSVKNQSQTKRPAPKHSHRQNKKVGLIAAIVIAVVVLIGVFALFGGRSYKATIKKYVNATYDVNAGAIFDLVPDDMMDYMLEDDGYDRDDLEDLIEEANEELQNMIDQIERYVGEDWKLSYKIANAEKVTGDDLADLKKDYKKMGVKVSAAKTVKVELTVKYGETESSNTMNIPLIKVGRSWYLDVDSMGSLF